MYKSKLQELCQKKAWVLPEYVVERGGVDHNPRFQATVTVNGVPFQSESFSRSAKDAQNDAAKLAFLHFTAPASGFSSASTELNGKVSTGGTFQVKVQETNQIPQGNGGAVIAKNNDGLVAQDDSNDKNLLQELAQREGYRLPTYSINKIGGPHIPTFVSTVEVEGEFFTGQEARNKKQAEISAAKVAYTALKQRSSSAIIELNDSLSLGQTLQLKVPETNPTLEVNGTATVAKTDDSFREMHNLYKNQLQSYAQKRNITLPMYSSERVGPRHASRFKCRVTIDGQDYESQEYFPTLSEAEHAAAKSALMSLLPDGIEEDESGYKNLLQELAQKDCYPLPAYSTIKSGEAHMPTFVSTVEVEGEFFTGREARTKKQAEMSAAKVAYMALKQRNSSQSPMFLSPTRQGQQAPQFSSSGFQSDFIADLQKNIQPRLSGSSEQSKVDRGTAEASCHQQPATSLVHESGSAKSRVSSSLSLSIPSSPDHGLSLAPLPSNSFTNVTTSSSLDPVGMSTLCPSRVIVHPRGTNMTYPEGSIVLSMSDENWVAVKIALPSNQENL